MRILAIRGSNLASLAGDFAVDFANGPLGDAGIFAITGPTGAGKSTLRDAMSLALFDAIPRLAGAPASGQLSDDEFSPRDPRAILRHGAGEGHAELDFVARDGRSYRSRWSVRRARGRADGRVQQAGIDLECLDTGKRLGGRKRETLAEIERLIGLNAAQFGRAVVLAQGEFEAFIKASGDERAQLLEKLTGATIYTVLGRNAFEKAKDIRSGYEGLKHQIARQEGLSDDERAALEAAIAEADTDREAKKKAHEALQAASRWTERLAELTEKTAQGREARDAAQQAVAEAAPRERALKRRKRALDHAGHWRQLEDKRGETEQARRNLAERVEAEEKAQKAETAAQAAEKKAIAALEEAKANRRQAEPELLEAREANRAIAEAEKRREETAATLTGCREAHDQAQAAVVRAEAAYKEAQEKRAELEQWRESNARLEALARAEPTLVDDLSAFSARQKDLEALQGERDGAEAEAGKAQEALEETGEALARVEEDHGAAKEALRKTREEAPDAATLQRLESAREALREVQTGHGALQQAREHEAEADAQLAATRQLTDRIKAEQAERERELSGIEADLPALFARKEEAEHARTRALAASDQSIVALREALEDGEPCPVCGATEHRLGAVKAIFGEAVEEARNRAAETSGALDEARNRQTVLKTEIAAGGKNLEGAKNDAERHAQTLAARVSDRELREADRSAAMAKADLDPGMAEDDLLDLLAERLPQIDAERERLRGSAARLEAARHEEEKKRAACDTAREDRDRKQEAQRKAAEALAAIARRLDGTATEQDHIAATLDRTLKDLADWRALPDPADWVSHRAREWRGKEEESRDVDARVPALLEQWTTDRATASTASRDFENARTLSSAAQATMDEKLSARQALLGGRPVAELEIELSEAFDKAEAAQAAARDRLGTARTEAASARSHREGAEETLSRLGGDLARLQEAFDKALSATDLSPEEVAEAAGTGSQTLEKEEDELRGLQTALAEAMAALEQREADLVAHEQSERPETDRDTLAARLEEAKAALETAEATLKEQEFRLRKDDDVRQQTAELRAELAEAQEKGRVWEELAELIGDAQGKTLRNFAQSLTLDRLLEFANDRLADLKPRYALQRASGGEMLIEVIDNDMAGQVRGLQNLSGGERFLVSLALALGLAEMSTGRGVRIESLFIDEGFGALDSASLGQAIAVLEHLHSQGRRVGVISHVEELKERIPVKVEVNPISGGRSDIAITID